jgi:hypothetical protein
MNFLCKFADVGYFSAALAACSINRATSAGCEMNGHVTRLDLGRLRSYPVGVEPVEIGIDGPIILCDQVL